MSREANGLIKNIKRIPCACVKAKYRTAEHKTCVNGNFLYQTYDRLVQSKREKNHLKLMCAHTGQVKTARHRISQRRFALCVHKRTTSCSNAMF